MGRGFEVSAEDGNSSTAHHERHWRLVIGTGDAISRLLHASDTLMRAASRIELPFEGDKLRGHAGLAGSTVARRHGPHYDLHHRPACFRRAIPGCALGSARADLGSARAERRRGAMVTMHVIEPLGP